MDVVNSTRLVGRVGAVGEPRQLPSGDTLVTLRVIVPRAPRAGRATGKPRGSRVGAGEGATGGGRGGGSATTVDTIDVACWTARVRRVAARLTVDDHVEVEGALRRRFFRAGGSVASRYEVEARTLTRRAAPTS